VALLTYLEHPARVSSLVLSGGLAGAPRWFALQRAIGRVTPEPLLARMLEGSYSGKRPEHKHPAGEDFRRCGKRTYMAALAELSGLDLGPRLSRVTAPTLVLCGSNDRANSALSKELAAGMPSAELRIAPAPATCGTSNILTSSTRRWPRSPTGWYRRDRKRGCAYPLQLRCMPIPHRTDSPAAPTLKTPGRRNPLASVTAMRPRSLAWAGFAASAWAIAYAIGVRVYQGLGGRLGLAWTFQDPAAMRRASLMAGVGILLAVLGVILSSSTVGLRATKRRSSPGTSCSTSPGFSGSGCWSARNAALQPPLRRLCPCGTAARDHHRRGDACPDAVLQHPGRREQRVIVRRSQRRRLVHCYWSRIRSRAMVWSLDSGALDERRTVMTEACCRRGAFLASKASPISG
jgi:hypothetical protein